MRSNNPVLSKEQSFAGFSGGAFTPHTRSMTMDDVVVKSSIMLGILAVVGAISWVLNVPIGIAVIAGLAAFVVGLVGAIKRQTTPALYVAYAVLEGVLLGAVSHLYETAYNGIVIQALLGVVVVFGVMLALYKARIIRVTNRFVTVVAAAGLAFVALMIVNLIAGFIVPGGLGLTAGGPLAIAFAALGVVIGAFFYAIDFRQVEDLIRAGAPEREAWRASFGLTLTTVWVYVNILRLIGYLRN